MYTFFDGICAQHFQSEKSGWAKKITFKSLHMTGCILFTISLIINVGNGLCKHPKATKKKPRFAKYNFFYTTWMIG